MGCIYTTEFKMYETLNRKVHPSDSNKGLAAYSSLDIKGEQSFPETPYFYWLDEKPLWKLKESKKPHLKIFSRSRNKGIFVYGW